MKKYIFFILVILFSFSFGVERKEFLKAKSFSGFDSLNTRFIGNWPFGPAYAVSYDPSRSLCFLGSGGGVYILDVSNPSNPIKVSEGIHTRGIVYGLFYSNNKLYIACGQGGLEIWDVTNPNNPTKLGYYFTPDEAWGVYVLGSYAYVADGWAGLRIIDITNPRNPIEVGYYNTPGWARDVYVSGSYCYVADDEAGLQIYQFYGGTPNVNEEKPKIITKEKSLKTKKLYDITGKLVNEKKLKKGIYFKVTEKGKEKILILK
ncbi:MAG: hypothetical protein N2323_07000 [candidate division WOR-3 bacterium]|nr:hypothetical protein [candidate division WOR-3 bacterium]